MTPFEETINAQRLAADPDLSAFVLANAGSGKTRVLIDRVARLLLQGTKPERILCITFTKAAAAEMTTRLFDKLGAWSLAEDSELTRALEELEGAPSDRDLNHVRRLFARALETPGGLKIQTIHSFCESVLHRFPIEAGAPPGFSVIDDKDADALALTCLNEIATDSAAPLLGDALRRLTMQSAVENVKTLFVSAVAARQKFINAIAGAGDAPQLLSRVAAHINVDPARSGEALIADFLAKLSAKEVERAADALGASGGNAEKKWAPALRAYLKSVDANEKWETLTGVFLTSTGTARKQIASKKTDKVDPWTRPYLDEVQEAVLATVGQLKTTNVYHDTAAFITVLDALCKRYESKKAGRAALDYDDLIIRTRRLFADAPSQWVMFKLDQGLDHILIDEAQDTSPGQWDVVEGPLQELLAGAGARGERRTFFAVGDKKQSIYSFQGADVDLFSEKEITLGKKLDMVGRYRNVKLNLSFRTTAPVLQFVDTLFPEGDALEGLGSDALTHPCHRIGDEGLVELWPLTPRAEKEDVNPWDAPVDTPRPDDPTTLLTREIARKIKDWLATGETLASQGRPIAAGDVMILVQSRGRLFDDVIRTLAREGVPVAGADKLKLLEDPAIEDILSYARFALNPTDDLSLAEILKSPLFNLSEDELFDLCHDRGSKSLWRALLAHAKGAAIFKSITDQIETACAVATREGPFAFISHILEAGETSGRRRFYERLTPAVRESIDELLRQALDYERGHPRSLQGFLSWFESSSGEIKREMDQTPDAVRVMTVHGAKGLEANIVFLIDGHRGPQLKLGPVFETPEGLLLFSTSKERDCPQTAAARDVAKAKEYEEYRRLLYVAATRARDRLYICGVESGNVKDPLARPVAEQTWHALATTAFDRLGAAAEVTDNVLWDEPVRRFASPQKKAVKSEPENAAQASPTTPDWLFAPATEEKPPPSIAPSRFASEEDDGTYSEGAAYSPTGDTYARGRVLHRLLELLPAIRQGDRPHKADLLLERLAPWADAAERGRWREEVITVLEDPAFSAVFAPGSKAEVSIAGAPKGIKDGAFISGQIDRLAVTDSTVLVVDFKTNRPPPATVERAPAAYLTQMAAYRVLLQEIYPDHKIVSALLWTFDARLMEIPDALLDHAFARNLAAG